MRVIGDLERGRRANYLETTLGAVEGALGWGSGSCRKIVAGGSPAQPEDPMLARLMVMWPTMSADARALLVALAERSQEIDSC